MTNICCNIFGSTAPRSTKKTAEDSWITKEQVDVSLIHLSLIFELKMELFWTYLFWSLFARNRNTAKPWKHKDYIFKAFFLLFSWHNKTEKQLWFVRKRSYIFLTISCKLPLQTMNESKEKPEVKAWLKDNWQDLVMKLNRLSWQN